MFGQRGEARYLLRPTSNHLHRPGKQVIKLPHMLSVVFQRTSWTLLELGNRRIQVKKCIKSQTQLSGRYSHKTIPALLTFKSSRQGGGLDSMCALTRALRRVLTCEDESWRAFGLDGRRPLRPFRLSVLTTAEHDGRQEGRLS